MTPATIVIVNDFGMLNGGASKVAIESALGLRARGHRVIFFCAVPPIDPSLAAQVEVICLNQYTSLQNPSNISGTLHNLWNRAAARALDDLLADVREGPVLVHVHVWTKALSASIFSAIRRAKVPFAITLHDYFAVCPNGALFLYPEQTNCSYRPLSTDCIAHNCDKTGLRSVKIFRVFRQLILKHIGGLGRGGWHAYGVSEFALSRINPHLPSNVSRRIIPNPGEIDRMAPVAPERSDIFLAVGRLVPEKGMILFAEAAKRAGVRAVFIGEGSEAENIRAANPEAELLGWLDHAHVLERMRMARALIFPSLWPETQGLVVDEAAALGIPAIVSDNTAACDRVADGVEGLQFRSGDVGALADCLQRMTNTEAARMGAAAYSRYWETPYTLRRHLDALEHAYNDLLGTRSTGR